MWQLLVLAFKGLPFDMRLVVDESTFRKAIKPNSLIRAPFLKPPKVVIVASDEVITSFLLHISPLSILKPVYKASVNFQEDGIELRGRFTLGAPVRLGLYLTLLGALAHECISVVRFIRAVNDSMAFDQLFGFALGLFVAPLALTIALSIGAQILAHYRDDMESIVQYLTKLGS